MPPARRPDFHGRPVLTGTMKPEWAAGGHFVSVAVAATILFLAMGRKARQSWGEECSSGYGNLELAQWPGFQLGPWP